MQVAHELPFRRHLVAAVVPDSASVGYIIPESILGYSDTRECFRILCQSSKLLHIRQIKILSYVSSCYQWHAAASE